MPQINASVTSSFKVAGFSFAPVDPLSGNNELAASYNVPVAQPGILTVRTDGTDGSLTMTNAGHGIITGALLDIYFAGGACYQATVGTVAGEVVPFTGAKGTALPIATTPIVAAVPVKLSFPTVNANLVLIADQCNFEGQFTYIEADNTTIDWHDHCVPTTPGTSKDDFWASGMGASPLTGTAIANVFMSHADIAAAHVMTAVYLSL
jgi:hypothetical protein